MNQLSLLEAPKTGVSRQTARRREVEAFKKANRIWTHRADFRDRKDHPWSALYFHEDLEKEYGTPFEAIAGYCRILEEQGYLVTGETERDAIRKLAENMGVHCSL